MMVAFVDFMSNRMNFNHPYCQCGSVLSIVYPDQSGTNPSTTGIPVSAFDDFRTFLKKFAVDAFPANTRLPDVVKMITEITTLCPTACAPLSVDELRPYWMQDAHAVRLEKERQEAEARRLAQEAEALRLAQEAEALRLAQEAEERRLAQEAQEAQLRAAAAAADEIRRKNAMEFQKHIQAKKRAEAAAAAAKSKLSSKSGVTKPQITSSKKSDALAAHQIQSAIAAQQEPQEPQQPQQQQQEPQQQEPAVPTGLLSRLSRLDPRSWSLPSWLRRKGGGTRKRNKHNHKHKHSLTKRRH
jgi:hypothetical protein